MKNRFSIKVRPIAAILITAFLIQDIAWACPFEGYKNLAVTGLQNQQTLQNLKTAMSKKLKAGSPDMAKQKDGAHFYSSLDLDITNGFIRNHIAEGRAVEVYEKEEKVVIIRRDYTNSKVPDIERHFRANGIFNKIRQSKDPALLKKILREKSNFRNLSLREQKKIIQIIQDIRLSLILGHVIVYEEPYNNTCIFGHARTGLNGYRHHLGPTIWIGEILFNRLTVKESAQFLLEEALHILKPATPHGKIDKAENPKEVIEHNEELINSIDLSPVIRDELAASAGMGRFESPDMAKERMLINRQGTPSLPGNVVYNKIIALNESEIIDDENEHFILNISGTKNLIYPILVNIRRKQDHISIGTVELDVRYITVGGEYILDLGLVYISLKKYRKRGIFPRVLSLISGVMPPNSKLDLSSLQETETLKAFASGTGWSETRMGRILYRCGWEPEFIAIANYPGSLEAVLLDKNNERPELYNPDNFKVILRKAINGIDKTDEISYGVTVYVKLAKITDRARIDESLNRERLPKPESPDMAKGDTEKIKGEDIEDMLLAVHSVVQSGVQANPFPEGSRVVLSSNLFEEMEIASLERLLKDKNVEILDPKDIKRRATNNKVARDKMVIVLTKEEFEAMWKGPDERLWIRSSVLLLDDRLTGPNYLYLEGVIGLARAIMGRDKRSVATFYNMLSGMKLDEAALVCLEDNAVAFAIKAILKFKPIEADSRRLDNYKVIMETFLVSA